MSRAKSPAILQLQKLALNELKRRYPSFPYPPTPKYQENASNELKKCVIDYIRLRGFQAERINTTGTRIDTCSGPKWVKGRSQPGSADISATIQGRSVKIEIKCKASGDNVQSDKQKEYQKEVERAGGVYLIVTNFQDFYEWFNKKR